MKKYNSQIPDLKNKLRDILFTLKNLKFDNDIKFKPCANWLLAKNNLARLVNGEFGVLMHKKTEQELRREQAQKLKLEEQYNQQEQQILDKVNSIKTKDKAIEFLKQNVSNKRFLTPVQKELIKKFNITNIEF